MNWPLEDRFKECIKLFPKPKQIVNNSTQENTNQCHSNPRLFGSNGKAHKKETIDRQLKNK